MTRRALWGAALLGGAAPLLLALAVPRPVRSAPGIEVVATGVDRPLQVLVDGAALLILSHGPPGASAGEIHRVELTGALPVDLSREARIRIPFADSRLATLGSLAQDPSSHELFLGEENGSRIYRLSSDDRLRLYAVGLQRLAGGSTLTFDRSGRLVVVDYVDPTRPVGDERGPPGLEHLRGEDYRGPLVFRVTLDPEIPLPRRLDRTAPLFPRAWGGRAGGGLLPRLISVAAGGGGELAFLSSGGEMLRLSGDGRLTSLVQLPSGYGQYNRTSMASGPDGSVYVSGGFQVGRIFRVSPEGHVTIVARSLADPEGIALDAQGYLYVAESSFHRIIRLRPDAM